MIIIGALYGGRRSLGIIERLHASPHELARGRTLGGDGQYTPRVSRVGHHSLVVITVSLLGRHISRRARPLLRHEVTRQVSQYIVD